jgi:hypothetical protein
VKARGLPGFNPADAMGGILVRAERRIRTPDAGGSGIEREQIMSVEQIAFLTLLTVALAVPTILFLLLRSSLRGLLRHTLKLQAGVTFYLRSFLLCLYLAALSGAIEISFDLKSGSHFMEYVWKGAAGVSSLLQNLVIFVSLYLVLITILTATLKVDVDE